MNPTSPCVNICVMDPHSRYCKGCWRTLDEIAAWAQMSEMQRQEVWRELPLRQKQLTRYENAQPTNKLL